MARSKETLLKIDTVMEEEAIMLAYTKPGYWESLSSEVKERIIRFNLMHDLMIEHNGSRLKVENIMQMKGYPQKTIHQDFPVMERVFGRVRGYNRAYENLMAANRLKKALEIAYEKSDLKAIALLEKEYRECTKHDADTALSLDFEKMKELWRPNITFNPAIFKVKNDPETVRKFLENIDKKYALKLDDIDNAEYTMVENNE